MCCIFLVLTFLGPRTGILVWWLFDQARWNLTFPNFIWPFLGFLFLPWTTLMYVIVWPMGMGIDGFDWVWLGLAFLADIVSYSSSVYRRQEIPGYNQYVSRG